MMYIATITRKTVKQFTNITKDANDLLRSWKHGEAFDGLLNIYSMHTTAGIKIMENEILMLADLNKHLDKLAPKSGEYLHNEIGIRDVPPQERINGHSHIRALYFPTSETIPIRNGKLMLGKWQQIFLVELDSTRERTVSYTLITAEQ